MEFKLIGRSYICYWYSYALSSPTVLWLLNMILRGVDCASSVVLFLMLLNMVSACPGTLGCLVYMLWFGMNCEEILAPPKLPLSTLDVARRTKSRARRRARFKREQRRRHNVRRRAAQRRSRPRWKRKRKFRRRRLPYHLVRRCSRRRGNHPKYVPPHRSDLGGLLEDAVAWDRRISLPGRLREPVMHHNIYR